MDVMVNERREPLDVLRLNHFAGGTKLVQRQAHVARVFHKTIAFSTSPSAPSWSS
jgi:hypothetical protein